MKRFATIQLNVKVSEDTAEQIKKLANSNHITVADQLREFIERGLTIHGYEQQLDTIATIIRQEFMAIYHVEDIQKYVELAVEKQTSRMEKMLTKVGKISAGGFFLLVKTLLQHTNEDAEDDFALLVEQAGKMGIEFMQQKNSTVNDILSDGKYVCRTAETNL